MLIAKHVRTPLIVITSVYIGTLLALLAYALVSPLLGGSYSIIREYFASFVSVIVWSGSSLMIGSYIDNKSKIPNHHHRK